MFPAINESNKDKLKKSLTESYAKAREAEAVRLGRPYCDMLLKGANEAAYNHRASATVRIDSAHAQSHVIQYVINYFKVQDIVVKYDNEQYDEFTISGWA